MGGRSADMIAGAERRRADLTPASSGLTHVRQLCYLHVAFAMYRRAVAQASVLYPVGPAHRTRSYAWWWWVSAADEGTLT